jgi:hypothetical protein
MDLAMALALHRNHGGKLIFEAQAWETAWLSIAPLFSVF